ncbi:MAG TPA: ChaN family lipoprotein [Chlorobaculum sp.]|nr:ChaN family lipoprotein [Chlorobaculum sp.]
MVYSLLMLLVISCFSIDAYGHDKAAFVLYDKADRAVSYHKLLKKVEKSDVVLFGELHDNPIAHWLQLELSKDLHKRKKLIMGAEMFEADNQKALDDYLSGLIDYPRLNSLVSLWSNYKTDYAPLVDFARDHRIRFIGTNIPKRFARLVHKNGGFAALDKLGDEEKKWIAPLPVHFDPELPGYRNILTMAGEHGTPELVKAQAIKDATMAHFILLNHKPGHSFLHFNGAYHSDFHEGIVFYLRRENDSLRYLTITTVEQQDIRHLEAQHRGRADFIICVDSDMTKTF